ncbi:MAG TPA: hypothetical protein DCM86_11590 [Verrucomicrobiales bacterium]|nr:hypothetical protein [Verrucomicrobiales bacterium]
MHPLPPLPPAGRARVLLARMISSLAIVASGIQAATPSLPEWPQFLGPAGSGHPEAERPAPVEFGPGKNVEWSVAVPQGHSSPCVAGGRIFLTAARREDRTLITLCIDRATGKLLWSRERQVEHLEHVHGISNSATATPATDGEAVFAYFASYGITAYGMDGSELWTQPLPEAVNRMGFGSGTSPIVAGGRVVIDVHAGTNSHLLALECRSGKPAWKAPNPLFNEGWSTPVTWKEGAEPMVGVLNAQRFSARRLSDGSEKWFIPGLPNQTCATPAVGEGMLILTGAGVLGESTELIRPPSFDEAIAKYDSNKDGKVSTTELPKTLLVANRKASGGAGDMTLAQFITFGTGGKPVTMDRAEWEEGLKQFDSFAKSDLMTTRVMAVRTGGSGDVSQSAILWSESRGTPEVPSPLLFRNRIHLVKSGGVALCRDAATGKLIYEERFGTPGGHFASPVACAGRIYLSSDQGVVSVLESGDSLKVLARNDLKEPILATPAIVEGRLYVRTAGHLYAFK